MKNDNNTVFGYTARVNLIIDNRQNLKTYLLTYKWVMLWAICISVTISFAWVNQFSFFPQVSSVNNMLCLAQWKEHIKVKAVEILSDNKLFKRQFFNDLVKLMVINFSEQEGMQLVYYHVF